MLTVHDLTIRIAGRVLIEKASFMVPSGAKVGLVGPNGSGKTTLFRAIKGDIIADHGSIEIARSARIAQVEQEVDATDDALSDIVLRADKERAALMNEAETTTDPYRIGNIHVRLAEIDAYSAPARASAILNGLGFDEASQKKSAGSFSGGWRMRVALAAVLFSRPDILLLDEPTNYLDLEGTIWLEGYINRYPGTAIIISHDREFLNRTINAIVHLEQRKFTFYRGTYDQFEQMRAEAINLQAQTAAKISARRKHMEIFVERFRYKASKARQAQSRLKALEKMPLIELQTGGHAQKFLFPDPEKQLLSPIIRIEEGSVGYQPGMPILQQLNLRIDADDRIALLGANGNGKSTFAKLIADRLKLETGIMTKASGLKVGMFTQHQMDDLVPTHTPVEHVRSRMKALPESKVRARVSQMGLTTEKMDTPAKNLSGGEKARLLLGLTTLDAPHLLILDEPTNHLDMDGCQALVAALNQFSGAVILISHDRSLIDTTMDRLWLVKMGCIQSYDGDMESYRRDVINGVVPVSLQERKKTKPRSTRPMVMEMVMEIKKCESRMTMINKQITEVDKKLLLPDLFKKEPESGIKFSRRRKELERDLQEEENKWLELSRLNEEGLVNIKSQ